MADTASSVLRYWETTNVISTTGSGVIVRKSESGTVRLVRTACKTLSKHGSEQSGVYQLPHFYSHRVYLEIHWHLFGEIGSIFFL